MYLFTLVPSILHQIVILYCTMYFVGFYYWKDCSMSYAMACMYLVLDCLLEDKAYYLTHL